MAIEELESSLGLRFKDRGLLQQALVHRSFLNEPGGAGLDSYERMEFLGDAVLELVISTELYRSLPRGNEGELTQGRSALVCRPSLARAARRLSLGEHLFLGKGEKDSGGQRRESILEEVFESVVAAIYLDQGYETARRFILQSLEPELTSYYRRGETPENPKSRLQEMLQGRGHSTPRYQVVAVDGPAHQPVFTVEVLTGPEVLGRGSGTKKADAERAAAQEALAQYAAFPEFSPEAGEPGPAPPAGTGAPAAAETKTGTHRRAAARQSCAREHRARPKAGLCSPSSSATAKTTRNAPRKASSAAGNAGSGVSSAFSAPLTWMKQFGRNWKKS